MIPESNERQKRSARQANLHRQAIGSRYDYIYFRKSRRYFAEVPLGIAECELSTLRFHSFSVEATGAYYQIYNVKDGLQTSPELDHDLQCCSKYLTHRALSSSMGWRRSNREP